MDHQISPDLARFQGPVKSILFEQSRGIGILIPHEIVRTLKFHFHAQPAGAVTCSAAGGWGLKINGTQTHGICDHWTCLPLTCLYQVENNWFGFLAEEESFRSGPLPHSNEGVVGNLSKRGSITEHPATPEIPHEKIHAKFQFNTRFICTRDEK